MTTLTLGLTESDRTDNYFPMMDGYRAGATQRIVSIDVEGVRADDPEAIAEAAFIATNAPQDFVDANPNAKAIQEALIAKPVPMRSLSVGDTVTIELPVGTRTYAVDHVGWKDVTG